MAYISFFLLTGLPFILLNSLCFRLSNYCHSSVRVVFFLLIWKIYDITLYLCSKSLFKQDLVQQTPGCQNSIRDRNKITDLFTQPCLRLSPLYQIVHEYRKKETRNPGFLDLNQFTSVISWLWIPPQDKTVIFEKVRDHWSPILLLWIQRLQTNFLGELYFIQHYFLYLNNINNNKHNNFLLKIRTHIFAIYLRSIYWFICQTNIPWLLLVEFVETDQSESIFSAF